MTKENKNNLPAYTNVENILSLIEILKRKNKNEDEVKAVFGKSNSVYNNTKSALRAFNLIEDESLEFTDKGRIVAYSQDSDKKFEIMKIVNNFPPYETFLFSLLKKDDITKTEIDEIVNFWGKAHYGSTQRNMEDAAKLFMSIIDFIGFGKYITGRSKNPTRIEWVKNIKDKIAELYQETDRCHPVEQKTTINAQENYIGKTNIIDVTTAAEDEENPILNSIADNDISIKEPNISAVNLPNITINVDMSDWPIEKIKIFFKYAYGMFEED